nr:hypothetical protein [Tanacetum cinerariifolium]
MTTSSTDNSVFRSFFEKQKLTGPNFIDWYRQLRIVLLIEDKLHYLEQTISSIPETPEGQQVAPKVLEAHYAWIKGSKKIASLMLMKQELLQTTRDFHSCKQEEGQSVSSYVLKTKGYIDNLERLGHPVTLGHGVSLILIGLRKEGKNHGKGKNKQAYALKPKIPPPPRRENPTKDSICHECGEIGHWIRNCPLYLADLIKKKKNTTFEVGGS